MVHALFGDSTVLHTMRHSLVKNQEEVKALSSLLTRTIVTANTFARSSDKCMVVLKLSVCLVSTILT